MGKHALFQTTNRGSHPYLHSHEKLQGRLTHPVRSQTVHSRTHLFPREHKTDPHANPGTRQYAASPGTVPLAWWKFIRMSS